MSTRNNFVEDIESWQGKGADLLQIAISYCREHYNKAYKGDSFWIGVYVEAFERKLREMHKKKAPDVPINQFIYDSRKTISRII